MEQTPQERRNLTLALPVDLLRHLKRLAADRQTSISSLAIEALSRLTDEERRYRAACRRSLAAMERARDLGTRGKPSWSRDATIRNRLSSRPATEPV